MYELFNIYWFHMYVIVGLLSYLRYKREERKEHESGIAFSETAALEIAAFGSSVLVWFAYWLYVILDNFEGWASRVYSALTKERKFFK